MNRSFRQFNLSADAEVRTRFAAYNAVRRQFREIALVEPNADEPANIHDGFDRLAKAAAIAERTAWDALYNAVASYTGRRPCAVVIDSVGGSSVVTLSGKSGEMIVSNAADRVRVADVICRPEPPSEFAHEWRQMAPNQAGNYVVMQRGDVVAIYNGVYFRSTNDVVADLLELLQASPEGVWSDDYVVWCNGRIMAVIHRSMDRGEQTLFLLNEPHNDPIAGRAIEPMPYWPTFEKWVESGRGDLWKTDRYQ
jgi:hypothetical protein